MKKKFLLLIMLFASLFMIVGCSKDEDDDDESSSKKSKEIVKEGSISKATIEESVILDKDGIKITAKSLKYSDDYVTLKLLIENSTDKDVIVLSDYFVINDLVLDYSFYEEVAAGKKVNTESRIYSYDLEISKITAIKDIEIDVTVMNEDLDEIFTEKCTKISTNKTDYEQEYNTEGTLLFDEKGVKAYVLKFDSEDSFLGADLYIYIENNTDKDITISTDDTSINGYMTDSIVYADIPAGKKIYSYMVFTDSDLEENDIKDIEDITDLEAKFRVYDSSTYDSIFKTDTIKINLK